MSEPKYRELYSAVRMGKLVQFQLPGDLNGKWINYSPAMKEPTLGYRLCRWRIAARPTPEDKR